MTVRFEARYFDGRSSGARTVRVHADPRRDRRVRIEGDGVELTLDRRDVRVSPRLGSTPRVLYLPDGARCESPDHDAVETAFSARGGIVHALERRWSLVAGAAAITALFLWAGFQYALPALASAVAHAVPPHLEARMGEQSLAALDARLLAPTRLPEAERARVEAAFRDVLSGIDLALPARLELRHSETLGANALALPAGIVVVTDAMVELAANDAELKAVIAHELGHVHHRHILRSVLQGSVAALLVATLLGDVTSVTGLAASIPTFLVEQHYSRAFEYEADAFALEWMRAHGIDEQHFARILARLHAQAGGGDDGLARYLSTHPSTQQRIEAIGGTD